MSYLEKFRRAIGLKPSMRRSRASQMSNILFGSVIGVISGRYIFEEPLKNHFEQQQNEQVQHTSKDTSGS